jgi:nitroreductase
MVVYMDFYDVVESRRSIRSYKDIGIEREKLYRILESSTLVPSWSCKHCWRFMVIDDNEIKNRIAQCINETNPARHGVFEASMAVVMCADPVNAQEIDEKEYYMSDCGIAMEHFMLAACSEGLSTCWIGLFDEDKLKIILGIPQTIRIVAITPLGYSNEIPEPRNKKTIKDIAYLNKWDNELVFK